MHQRLRQVCRPCGMMHNADLRPILAAVITAHGIQRPPVCDPVGGCHIFHCIRSCHRRNGAHRDIRPGGEQHKRAEEQHRAPRKPARIGGKADRSNIAGFPLCNRPLRQIERQRDCSRKQYTADCGNRNPLVGVYIYAEHQLYAGAQQQHTAGNREALV